MYLDDLDMDDSRKLSFYHVVPNSLFRMKLWPQWVSLVNAAYYGDVKGRREGQQKECSIILMEFAITLLEKS